MSNLGIGTDEWVAQHEERLASQSPLKKLFARIPLWAKWGSFFLIAFLFGMFSDNQYLLRVGVNLALFIMLSYGLNIVVGYAGILDLGYVAFYGFGAYGYALLSSEQLGQHWPTYVTVPFITILTAILGYLISLPSRRLFGDYLAIVTLFFGQVFVQLVLASDNITFPWADDYVDITAGSNGIPGLDTFNLFGLVFDDIKNYYWLLMAIVLVLTVAIHRVSATRIGRAWRTVREDALVSEVMGVSVNRVKTLAFVAGATIAGFAGTIFAGMQTSVFINGFDLPLMIMIYAAVILGGSGSLAGALIGAIIMTILPELLRVPNYGTILFFVALLLAFYVLSKKFSRFLIYVVSIILIGFAFQSAIKAIGVTQANAEDWVVGFTGDLLKNWLFVPENRILWGNVAFILLLTLIAFFSIAKPIWKQVLLPFIGFTAIFLWEVRLIADVSTTRQLIIGAMLVVLMILRPQGLFGQTRVEIL
jgi:branched-chain amino acid transport system permease protein